VLRRNFAELLDALERAGPGGDPAPAAATPARHRRAFVVEGAPTSTARPAPAPDGLAAGYLNETLRAGDEVEAPIAEQAWVAAALQLHAGMTTADLNRLRRTFALAHHPDRAGLLHRDQACRRMMIANMLIDQALASRAR
jgi:hypothetical protein